MRARPRRARHSLADGREAPGPPPVRNQQSEKQAARLCPPPPDVRSRPPPPFHEPLLLEFPHGAPHRDAGGPKLFDELGLARQALTPPELSGHDAATERFEDILVLRHP